MFINFSYGDNPVEFMDDNTFKVNADESVIGTWELSNDDTRLKLVAEGFSSTNYDFDVISLTCTKVKLMFTATVEVIGKDESYSFSIEFEMDKPSCN